LQHLRTEVGNANTIAAALFVLLIECNCLLQDGSPPVGCMGVKNIDLVQL
jgi:hypothetical protein